MFYLLYMHKLIYINLLQVYENRDKKLSEQV